MRALAAGAAEVIVTVPRGVPIRLVLADRGFGGQGYDVRFNRSPKLPNTGRSLRVQIKVCAPARHLPDGPRPLKVTLTPRGTGRLVPGQATGQANSWVILRIP